MRCAYEDPRSGTLDAIGCEIASSSFNSALIAKPQSLFEYLKQAKRKCRRTTFYTPRTLPQDRNRLSLKSLGRPAFRTYSLHPV